MEIISYGNLRLICILCMCIIVICSFYAVHFGVFDRIDMKENDYHSNVSSGLSVFEQGYHNMSSSRMQKFMGLRGINENKLPVLFIKTHKTGSSTVSSILWRQLCMHSHMNCFLPPASNPGRTWDFSRNDHKQYVQHSLGTQDRKLPFDVWLSHAKYHSFLTEIIPKPRVFLTIVRRPALRFQSAWYWYGLETVSRITLHNFARTLLSLPDSEARDRSAREMDKQWRFRTGLDSSVQELVGISKISKDFQADFRHLLYQVINLELFVLVNERFEESLLIMQWLLKLDGHDETCWFLPRKVQNYDRISNDTVLQALDAIQPHDLALYRAANLALDRMIVIVQKETNWHFPSEVQRLRQQLHSLSLACNTSEGMAARQHIYENMHARTSRHWNVSELCDLLDMDNDNFVQMFWEVRHNKELRRSFVAAAPGANN